MLTKRNPITPPENACRIPLSKGKHAIVDPEDYDELSKYYWRAVLSHACWYAVRRIIIDGRILTIRMHRKIAKTPPGMECHHENYNSLDNRKSNLTNMTEEQHRFEHGWR